MAKTKADLHKEGVTSGALPADSDPDDYTAVQLENLVGGDVPAAGWLPTATKPITAPDGHPTLSQEDIDARG